MAPRLTVLKELVHFEDWQKIQDSFADTFGVSISTIDIKGNLLFKKSNPLELCEPQKIDIPEYTKFNGHWVIDNDLRLLPEGLSSARGLFKLETFIFPIKTFGQHVVAFMVIGPVIVDKREDRSFYKSFAKYLGMDPDLLLDVLDQEKVFSQDTLLEMITLIGDVFTYVARTGYHKKRLGQISREIVKADPLFASSYEKKVINSLLYACKIALDAESGSVMKMDKLKHLHIAASSKLDKDIIDSSNQKVGEGIAGKAVETSEPIVLPKDCWKEGISEDMKRDDIKSSLIVPFKKADSEEVYGVLNLNIMRKNKEFSQKDIDLTKELVNLAVLALSSPK